MANGVQPLVRDAALIWLVVWLSFAVLLAALVAVVVLMSARTKE